MNGEDPSIQNNPVHILMLLESGIPCEVDVRYVDSNFYLGHDSCDYKIFLGFLKNKNLWVHCKDLASLEICLASNIHCFWHQNDDYTLTSKGYIWTFPGEKAPGNLSGVIVDLDRNWPTKKYNCLVCSDYSHDTIL